MHKIYEDKGNYNMINKIPQIIYSSIISSIISIIVKFLSLTEKSIINLKNINDNIVQKYEDYIKFVKIKFFIFYYLIFFLILFFWYYISCFCAVYKNNQIFLIKNTLISFSFSLFYPLILYLSPVILRIKSLEEKNKECIYKFSKILQYL